MLHICDISLLRVNNIETSFRLTDTNTKIMSDNDRYTLPNPIISVSLIHSSIHPSSRLYIHPSIHLFIYPPFHSSASIHLSFHPSIHASAIHLSIHLSIFQPLSIHIFVHPSIHSTIIYSSIDITYIYLSISEMYILKIKTWLHLHISVNVCTYKCLYIIILYLLIFSIICSLWDEYRTLMMRRKKLNLLKIRSLGLDLVPFYMYRYVYHFTNMKWYIYMY